jgi:hypothetical protein
MQYTIKNIKKPAQTNHVFCISGSKPFFSVWATLFNTPFIRKLAKILNISIGSDDHLQPNSKNSNHWKRRFEEAFTERQNMVLSLLFRK